MINTTYIRLAKAAEMLNTDPDSLMIAAVEGRIRLYLMLNQWRRASLRAPTRDGSDSLFVPDSEIEPRKFVYVPICVENMVRLLEGLPIDLVGKWLSDEDENGQRWMDETMPGSHQWSTEIYPVERIFARRDEVSGTSAQAQELPAGGTPNPAPDEVLERKSRTTALKMIAGLVLANYKVDIHASRLDGIGAIIKDFDTLGVDIDDKTLRTWLKAASVVVEKPKK